MGRGGGSSPCGGVAAGSAGVMVASGQVELLPVLHKATGSCRGGQQVGLNPCIHARLLPEPRLVLPAPPEPCPSSAATGAGRGGAASGPPTSSYARRRGGSRADPGDSRHNEMETTAEHLAAWGMCVCVGGGAECWPSCQQGCGSAWMPR